jgi:Ca2+-transporting ATPase
MEMLKALSAVSVSASMCTLPPWANKYLLAGVALPSLLHLAVFEAPRLAALLGVTPLTRREWRLVAALALPVLLLEEVLKAAGRAFDARKARKAAAALP